MSAWLDAVDPAYRDVHSEALATGTVAVAEIPPRREFAASLPVFASTGEAILLIQARLPADAGAGAVSSFVRRLALVSILLAVVALLASLLLARRIGAPIQALANYAERLGQGDFSSSIPAQGTQEVEALARTMDDMRRNLLDLTTTLRQNEAQAQAVLQGVVEGVYAVDADRRIRYLNPQAAKMLGAAPETLIGQFCGDVLKPRDIDGRRPCDFACPIYSARDDGKAQSTEYLTAGGAPRTVVITSAAPAGGLQVQVMRDETELEAVRRARDTVLANISHEFRTPLSAQLASVELMLDGLDGMPRERLGELLQSLQRGTLRLTRLIDNLLESVRIESGQLGIRRQPVTLAQVVEDAEDLMSGLLTQRRQVLRTAIPQDLPGHHGRCAAPHAGRHQPARQREQVRPRGQRDHGRRGAQGRGGRALGGGHRSRRAGTRGHVDLRAFLPRRGPRTGSARARPRPVDRQVDRRAPRRRGSRRPHAGRHDALHGEPADRRGGRVKLLVVDDDPDLLALVAFSLTNAGYAVVKAADTADALRVFDAELPNLVILDINLPSGSGFDVCKAIRARSEVPVMMLTARGDEEDLVRALELGADDYLTKPFSPRTLLARVKALLRRAGIEQGDVVESGRVALDLEAHAISIAGGAPLRLTRLETRLLQILVAQAGHVVSAERLLAHVWGHRGSGDRQLLKQLVHRLRQKLERDPAGADLLHTESGVGYRLKA